MQARIITLAALLFTFTAWGQSGGRINWANTSTTLIYTNDCNGTIGGTTGANTYRFGLYVGPPGTPADGLIFMALATNGGGLGRFTAPAFTLPPGFPSGPISVQVRGWSLFAGTTFEEAATAVINGTPGVFLGLSDVGSVTPTQSPIPPPSVFGSGPGQVSGFELQPGPCRQLAIRRMAPDGPTRIIHAGNDGLLLWTNMTNIASYRVRGSHAVDTLFTNTLTVTGMSSVVSFYVPLPGPTRFFNVEWMDAPSPNPVGTWDYQALNGAGNVIAAGIFTFTSNVPGNVSRNISQIQSSDGSILQQGTGAFVASSVNSSNIIELNYGGFFTIRGQMVFDYFAGDWFTTDYIINPPPGGPYAIIHSGRFVALRR